MRNAPRRAQLFGERILVGRGHLPFLHGAAVGQRAIPELRHQRLHLTRSTSSRVVTPLRTLRSPSSSSVGRPETRRMSSDDFRS